MNKTIVISNVKGGSGKSTLCMSLAAYAESIGKSVIVVDGDATGVTKFWADRRASDNVKVYHLPSNLDISHELDKIRKKNSDSLILVDCGGFDNIAMRSAVGCEATDLVVITSKCSTIDLFVARPFLMETVEFLKDKATRIVGCFMENDALPSKAKKILEAKEAMQGFGVTPINNFTVKRDAYRDHFLHGGDALVDPKAKAEIQKIFEELLEVMA